MIEVTKDLWVGNGIDAELVMADPNWRDQWFIVSACKEPYHREALGYTTRGAPRDDPEYLIAKRDGHLILNLVDVEDVSYINPTIIEAALEAMDENFELDRKVLVHCNKGNSRGPTIAMLWMHRAGWLTGSHEEVVEAFTGIYPDYAPAGGMNEYAKLEIEGAL